MLKIVSLEERHRQLNMIFSRSAVFGADITGSVERILAQVKEDGDRALGDLSERFDGIRPENIRVEPCRMEQAFGELDARLLEVFTEAADNIRDFHERQVGQSWFSDEGDGVILGQRVVPLDRVGLYVPGGEAFYPSSLLMNAIPAQVAGVREIVVASPPQAENGGLPGSLVLAAAHFLGIEEVYAVGGAQAIGALAFGTESVPSVDKVVGPGNAYVAAAKKMVFGPVDIDAVAGPSEIVVLADETANPAYVAADLLSQAEHDTHASAVLVTTSRSLAERVREKITNWWPELDRKEILEKSLADFSAAIVVPDLEDGIDVVNEIAPEHLEIVTADPWGTMTRIRHAGAIFLGHYSSEPVGDYIAGPNHVLPTSGTARYASALGVYDFVKSQSVISYTGDRLRETGPSIIRFANAEKLTAHARAIRVRLDDLNTEGKDGEGQE